MDEGLIKLLKDTGFSEKEAMIYLDLLEWKEATVSKIAKSIGLKRPLVYALLENLIEKGYVQQLPERKINTYFPADPGLIQDKLQVRFKHFSEMVPYLRTLGNVGKIKPKVSYIDDIKKIRQTYEEWAFKESKSENYFISSNVRINKYFPDVLDRYIKFYNKRKYKAPEKYLIPNQKDEIDIGRQIEERIRQEVRIADELNDLSMDFCIFNNQLIVTSFEDTPFMLIVESEEMVKSMRQVFELAWKNSKPLK